MDTDPKMNKTDDTLGVAFTNAQPDIPVPKGLLGNKSTVSESPQSHLTDHGRVFDVERAFSQNNVGAGTIVFDRKHARPTLGENIKSAFHEWWGKTSKSVSNLKKEPQKISEPIVVPRADTRATVVKEALSQTTVAPRDDHHIVVEKFRTYKQDVAKITGTPIAIKPPTEKKAEWTHITEETPAPQKKSPTGNVTPSRPLNPDLRSAMIAPIVDEKVRRRIKSFPPTKAIQKHEDISKNLKKVPVEDRGKNEVQIAPSVHKEAHTIHDVIEPPVVPTASPSIPYIPKFVKREEVFAAPKPKTPPPAPTPPSLHPISQGFRSTTLPPPQIAPLAPSSSSPAKETVQTPLEHSNAFKTFTLKWAIIVLIVLLGIALAIIASFYFNVWTSTSSSIPEEISVPTFFETTVETPLLFENSKQAFLAELFLRVTTATVDTVHIYPTLPDGDAERPATSEEILGLLAVNLPGKTLRALEDTIMFGSVRTNRNEPFMVLRSYNFDVLFAGLLEWEKTIQADLTPFFGAPETVTRFTDAVRDNKSIRILYNNSGNEVLLYSFIDKNTVVITTSGEALARLIAQF